MRTIAVDWVDMGASWLHLHLAQTRSLTLAALVSTQTTLPALRQRFGKMISPSGFMAARCHCGLIESRAVVEQLVAPARDWISDLGAKTRLAAGIRHRPALQQQCLLVSVETSWAVINLCIGSSTRNDSNDPFKC